MPTVLIVDDEPSVRRLVRAYLNQPGYRVYEADSGPEGLQLARTLQPDVIVLDVMLPGMDGMELLSRLREEDSRAYIIMLTARTEEMDRVAGLTLGADDYVTKPFSPRELAARVQAAIRRLNLGAPPSRLVFSRVEIDRDAHQVFVDGREVALTALEFALLSALAENHKRVMSREQLLEHVWGRDYFGDVRVVDVHIANLRRKLGDERLIETVRGVGYRFSDEPR